MEAIIETMKPFTMTANTMTTKCIVQYNTVYLSDLGSRQNKLYISYAVCQYLKQISQTAIDQQPYPKYTMIESSTKY